jgi:hypothetical protein
VVIDDYQRSGLGTEWMEWFEGMNLVALADGRSAPRPGLESLVADWAASGRSIGPTLRKALPAALIGGLVAAPHDRSDLAVV